MYSVIKAYTLCLLSKPLKSTYLHSMHNLMFNMRRQAPAYLLLVFLLLAASSHHGSDITAQAVESGKALYLFLLNEVKSSREFSRYYLLRTSAYK